MIKKLPNKGIVFWPIGTGDSTTICINKDTIMQIDLHHMTKSEDKEDPHYAIVDELINLLPKKNKKPYLSLFVLTHPDDDHIQGFDYLLKNVKIGEIWFTPKIFMEYKKDLCADAKIFRKEVDRRKELAIENSGDLESGDKLKIIGYDKILEEEEFKGFPDELLLYPGNETNEIDGKSYEEIKIFFHAPFKDDMTGEKNETSVGMQVELYNGEDIGSVLLFGDLDYPILKKIFDLSLKRSNKDKLRWDILLAPHHCSKSIMYYKDEGDEEEKFKKDIMDAFENNKGELGYVISSSEPIPSNNNPGDNPPHAKAKNRYEGIVDSGKFLCTQEHPSEKKTEPIVFSFGDNGFDYEKPNGDDDTGKSKIPPAIISSRGEKLPRLNQRVLEMNDNQKLALEQLEKISLNSEYHLEIIDYQENDEILFVNVSILCLSFKTAKDGLKYHQRESFVIRITNDFPFDYPRIFTVHTRFAGYPHVQWKRWLCLYRSPSTDWDSNDGMFGFIDQLFCWLEAAANNNLDPDDAPLHPPVAYKSDKTLPILIPTVDIPVFTEPTWYGFAKLKNLNDKSILIKEWYDNSFNGKKQNVAAVILLNSFMPFEYPNYFNDLTDNLCKNKEETSLFLNHLLKAVNIIGSGKDLFFIIGTPMRGFANSRKQHLSVWYLNIEICKCLRSLFGVHHEKHFKKLVEITALNIIDWCEVSEFRKEVTVKRDSSSAIEWFKDKTVELWGCGALGGYVAEYLVRAGIKKFILRDSKKVTPGILVRQNYFEENIGYDKVTALKNNLQRIYSKLNNTQIDTSNVNILINPLDNENIFSDADIIIDTTASESVIKKLECRLRNIDKSIPIVSMSVGHKALNGYIVISNCNFKGGLWTIKRKAKLNICSDKELKYYSDEFYPDGSVDRGKPFQPEPGRSENTFTGSSADISSLASSMLNIIANDLSFTKSQDSSAYLISQPHESLNKKIIPFREYNWKRDLVFDEIMLNYKVYFDNKAYEVLISLIEKSKKGKGNTAETGGILFGEWDDICKTVYIDEVTDAPKDSTRHKNEFNCGVVGIKEKNEKYKKLTKGSKHFIGYWHTHPYSSPDYSSKDDNGMKTIIITLSPQRALMLIVGFDEEKYDFNFYIFDVDKIQ